MMYWSLLPIWLLDVSGCLVMIMLSFLCLGVARKIYCRDPENALSAYLLWFSVAIFAFSLSRSLGHIIKHILYFAGQEDWWRNLSPFSGSINTITFVVIGAITLFFNRMEAIIHRMAQDKEKIEKTGYELLNLNKDMENIVSERTRAEMALRIAHEVRNPVTIIGGLVRRLPKMASGDKTERNKIESILSQTQKLEFLLSRFEGLVSEKSKHFAEEDISRLISQAIELVQPDVQEKNITLLYIQQTEEHTVQIDARLIKVVIVHLLRNALNSCEEEGSVRITTRMNGNWFELTIDDTGSGIPQDMLPHIFEPVYSSGEIKTGLGLPYIKQIIDEHRGTIDIESQGRRGTKVTIRIPVFLGELDNK